MATNRSVAQPQRAEHKESLPERATEALLILGEGTHKYRKGLNESGRGSTGVGDSLEGVATARAISHFQPTSVWHG